MIHAATRVAARIAAILVAIGVAGLWIRAAAIRHRFADAGVVWIKTTPLGDTICAAFSDESLRGFDAKTGRERFRFDGLAGQSTNPVSHEDSPLFFVQFAERLRDIWQTIGDLPGLAALKGGARLLRRETVLVDPTRGEMLYRESTTDDIDEVPVLGPSPDRYVVWKLNNRSGEQQIRVFDRKKQRSPIMELALADPIEDPTLSGDGRWIVCWRQKAARIVIFDASTGVEHPICGTLPSGISSSGWAISTNGKFLALGLRSGQVELWDMATQDRLAVYGPQTGIPERIVISADESTFVCVAQNGEVLAGAIPSGRLLFRAFLDGLPASDVRILTQLQRIVILDRSNTVRWWSMDVGNGVPIGTEPTLPGDHLPLELTESGTLIVLRDGRANLLDIAKDGKRRQLAAKDRNVTKASAARSGNLVAIATESSVESYDIVNGGPMAICWSATGQRSEHYRWLAWSSPLALFTVVVVPVVVWMKTGYFPRPESSQPS